MPLSANDFEAGRWRQMAEAARTKGEAMTDVIARHTMETVAEMYDRLAERETAPQRMVGAGGAAFGSADR